MYEQNIKKNSKGQDVLTVITPTLADLSDYLLDLSNKKDLSKIAWNGWDDGCIVVYDNEIDIFLIYPEKKGSDV